MQPHRVNRAADNRYIIQTIAYSSDYSCPIPSWATETAQTEISEVAKLKQFCTSNYGYGHHPVQFDQSLTWGRTAQVLFFISLAIFLSLHASISYSQVSLDNRFNPAGDVNTASLESAAPSPTATTNAEVNKVIQVGSSDLKRADSYPAVTLSYGLQQPLPNPIAEPQKVSASHPTAPTSANKTPYGLAKLAAIEQSNEQFSLPVTGFAVTSFFGNRIHPVFGNRRFHKGIDLGAPTGTPVRAARAGRVIATGWGKGYGNRIIINHGNGYETLYAHLDQLLVKVGDRVTNKAVIGLSGSTGYVTGPHLHFEIRFQQVARNPLDYFKGYLKP